jgi:aldose 1-epimerase
MIRLAQSVFGRTPDGTTVDLFTLRNAAGIEIRVITYGGVIVSLKTPDRTGAFDDIVLGFDDLESYLTKSRYFGCIVGRYGNRIAGGRFTLDGQAYTLATNNGPNHLHGGVRGWDKVVWHAAPFERTDAAGVVLRHTSADGDEGYPGEVAATVTYTLSDRDQLSVRYQATTTKPTVINLTQHTYFNLAGPKAADVLGHQLRLNASRFTPVSDVLIPTGEIASVSGTPFDFRTMLPIGARINETHEQLVRAKGYDHNFVLDRAGDALTPAAHVEEPLTGRTLDVATTEPALQFYSGNFLDNSRIGKGGRVLSYRSGFCLETQHFPDSPNHPAFPSTELRPGGSYLSETVFGFGTRG